ncbi:MAG: XRE family transcriptional regulator [Haliscomenobacteraceae bacterium CHB4]|nr:hypothetical protein [Saprospiraceae bacterium]MCE7923924.1 XRE family transcriptional regulator [Haliscomenobacteraceae bacterium CHB4]
MKKQTRQPARTYHSDVLEDFLSFSTPEQYARTESRMMLAAKIQDAMTAKGIGKKQLAEMMGQRPSVITKWLSGGHNFTSDTLTDIQRVLGVRLLDVGEKPAIQKTYQISVTVVLSTPETIPHPTGGQPYSYPSHQTDKVLAPVSTFDRKIPCA